jgi:hypothetical protein
MPTIPRHLRPLLIGLGFGIAMVLAIAFIARAPGDAAPSGEPVRVDPAPVEHELTAPNVDALVEEILGQPLFSPSRQPADAAAPEEVAETVKEPPKMPGRLAGMSIRPEGREALFEREGQKPIAVKEGEQIDGWTVASIQPDQVVLRSSIGEQTVKPTNALGIKPQTQALNRKPAAAAKRPNATAAPAAAARPPGQAQPPAAAQQIQRPGQTAARPGR